MAKKRKKKKHIGAILRYAPPQQLGKWGEHKNVLLSMGVGGHGTGMGWEWDEHGLWVRRGSSHYRPRFCKKTLSNHLGSQSVVVPAKNIGGSPWRRTA